MNSLFVVALLFGLAAAYNDGQWRGEGLAESQDNGQYNRYYGGYAAYAPVAYAGAWNYGVAPLAADGRVVDTAEVAHAKAAFFAAYNAAAAGGSAVALTADGKYLQDTPAVAQAKAAHFAAKAAATHGAAVVPASYGAWGYAPVALTANGKYLQDTPEVAQAKAAHFAAKAAATNNAYAGDYYGYNKYNQWW